MVSGTVVAATLPPPDSIPSTYATPFSPTNIPRLAGGPAPLELKYRLLEAYPNFFYCDPDMYPIARDDETRLAIERFPEIQSDPEQLRTVLSHNALDGLTTFTDQQKLLNYREYKRLNAIELEPSRDRYEFQFPIGQEGGEAFLTTGSIDAQGNIDIESREPTIATCPICLALGMKISTPDGLKPVEDLQVGDIVWTVDARGRRVAAALLQTGHVSVPVTHRMIGLFLEDGRQIEVSPGHSLPDGRRFRDLRMGDTVDGSRILSIEYKRYDGEVTYDILPAGDTGWYWANNILLASALFLSDAQ